MDSPSVKVRRRSSLPATRCSSFLLRMSKSNPYVGTFRHSPPTTKSFAGWDHHRRLSSWSLFDAKNSPYVGTVRHAPCSRTLQDVLCRLVFEKEFMVPKQVDGIFRLKDLLNGTLRGGGREDVIDWDVLLESLKKKSVTSPSATVQILSRTACWLLQPFHETSTKRLPDGYYFDEGSSICTNSNYDTDDGDDAHTTDEESDHDDEEEHTESGSASVISSQAAAYYAHQATNPSPQDHRLDDTITQMDVLRMMRNASRHLDVESIVRLPVYTYHKEPKDNGDEKAKEEMSWLLVGEECETRDVQPAPQHDRESCVICLEHFCNGDRVRVLPCSHSFHVGCIDLWLSGSHSFDDCYTSGCPTCKKRPDYDLDTEHSDGSVPSWAFARIGDALARSTDS